MPTLEEMRRMLREGEFADKPEKPKQDVPHEVTNANSTVTIEPVKVPVPVEQMPGAAMPQPVHSRISPRMFTHKDYRTNSNKFWTFEWVNSCDIKFRWGRIGTAGQSKVKRFDSHGAARNHLLAKIDEKLNKGYKESK